MATQIFLGKPSASVEAWIKGHSYTPVDPPTPPGPVARATTIITTEEDGE